MTTPLFPDLPAPPVHREIDADYLGGNPDAPTPVRGGTLSFSPDGRLRFSTLKTEGVLRRVVERFAVEPDEILAITVGDANHMQAITRGMAGAMIGGTIGGLIGMATGRRSSIVLVVTEEVVP